MITKPFYMSIFPVTQDHYEKVMGKNPSAFHKGHGVGPDNPVESVSWHDATAFCERLTRLNEEQTNARWYRLPTEAEWEFACRAGSTKAYSCGDKFTPSDGHYASAGAYGKTGGEGHTVAVGRFDANGFGLYDMHSNVMEWCSDWYDEYYYFESPEKDPQGPNHGSLKVVRGGCWMMFPSECRSAARRGHDPASHSNTIGFRVVLAMA